MLFFSKRVEDKMYETSINITHFLRNKLWSCCLSTPRESYDLLVLESQLFTQSTIPFCFFEIDFIVANIVSFIPSSPLFRKYMHDKLNSPSFSYFFPFLFYDCRNPPCGTAQ